MGRQPVNLERLLHVLETARTLTQQPHVICGSPEAERAWVALNEALARFDRHEADVTVTAKPCQYCKTPIFFAQLANGRFLPMETETVPSKGMIGHWRYLVVFESDPPAVTVRPNQEDGEVWVNHMHTCGASDGPKHKVAALVRRWKANQLRNSEVDEELMARLLAMRAGLEREGTDAEGVT